MLSKKEWFEQKTKKMIKNAKLQYNQQKRVEWLENKLGSKKEFNIYYKNNIENKEEEKQGIELLLKNNNKYQNIICNLDSLYQTYVDQQVKMEKRIKRKEEITNILLEKDIPVLFLKEFKKSIYEFMKNYEFDCVINFDENWYIQKYWETDDDEEVERVEFSEEAKYEYLAYELIDKFESFFEEEYIFMILDSFFPNYEKILLQEVLQDDYKENDEKYIDFEFMEYYINSYILPCISSEELKEWYCESHPKARKYIENQFEKRDFVAKEFEKVKKEKEKQKEQEKKMIEETKKQILKVIPDNIEDLYPLARTINRHFIIHEGATNTGKTYEALQNLKQSKSGVYLAPLRLLAFEIYETLNQEIPCNMITGEESILTENAKHNSMTIEMMNENEVYEVGVIDEAQMLEDRDRGQYWTAAILGLRASKIHICCAPYAVPYIISLVKLCQDTYEIKTHERKIPLTLSEQINKFPHDLKEGDCLIVFSRKDVIGVAAELQSKGWKPGVIYGSLPYEVRINEVHKFINHETNILVSTDAIGMGLNLPVERIVFLKLEKFDGVSVRNLKSQELKQIAGRAGRMNLFEEGFFTSYLQNNTLKHLWVENNVNMEISIPFPKSLLSIEQPLSRIIKSWNKLPTKEGQKREHVNLELCSYLEDHFEDKEVIYQFLTIPFNVNSDKEYTLWRNLVLVTKEKEDVTDFCKNLIFMPLPSKLEDLESHSKLMDVLYSYMRKFQVSGLMEDCIKVRKEVSGKIIQLLKEKKLEGKKCKDCGKKLSWFYPYNLCENCYNKGYYRYNDWYW